MGTRPIWGLGALCAALVLVGTGCGGSDEAAESGVEAIRVGLNVDAGQLDDEGFTELSYVGLTRAEEELSIEGRVLESQSPADYIPNMAALARQGYDLVIGIGFAQHAALARVAKQFPDVHFAIVDIDHASLEGEPANVRGLLFREEQVGYLAGYLAALTQEHAGDEQVIGAVGGYKEPPVDRFIAGYQAGAEAAVPGTEVIYGYSQDWEDQTKCKEIAFRQIARGAGVVFQVAGECGLGALSAAKEKGVWGIGVDADQSFLGPHILTSALKGVDQAVFITIEHVVDGTFQGGGNEVFGLERDGVGLGTISDDVPSEDLDAVAEVERQISDGEIEISTELAP